MPTMITRASTDDFDALWQFYTDVCAQQAHDQYSPMWTLDVYPAKEDIRGHLEAGEFYVATQDGRIAGALVITPHEDPEYAHIPWPTPAADDEVAVIHLLAVHPSMRGRHIGAKLVEDAIAVAGTMGKRVIHLDVVQQNQVASRIYKQAGFTFVGPYRVFYEDTGLMDFDMYEYAL